MSSVRNEVNADFGAELPVAGAGELPVAGAGEGSGPRPGWDRVSAVALRVEPIASLMRGHDNGRGHRGGAVVHYADVATRCHDIATDAMGRRVMDLSRQRGEALRERAGELCDQADELLMRGRSLRDYAEGLRVRSRSARNRSRTGRSPAGHDGHVARNGTGVAPGETAGRPSLAAMNSPHVAAVNSYEVEIPLLGGDMTEGVVRVGDTVRRPVRPHTSAVHALLRHLEAVGFDGAPRVLGIDDQNREILTYLPGRVPRRPLPDYALRNSTLVALAELERRYHEAAAGFHPPSWARWDGELTRQVDGPPTLVCHCDVNLENVIFTKGAGEPRPYAFIDFDLARPATRLVDVIQTLRYWAPIADPADRDPALRDLNAAERIAIFCEAYGLSYIERARLVAVASRWLRRSPATIARRARAWGGAWTRMLDAGVGDRLLRGAAWLERNRPEIETRLRRIGPHPPAPPVRAAQAGDGGHARRLVPRAPVTP